MAKYLMCLFRLMFLLFLAIKIATELSQYILNGLEIESTTLSPEKKLFNHTPCEVASKQDTNLASIVEIAIKVSFMLLQETVPPARIKTYPKVDFHESMQPT